MTKHKKNKSRGHHEKHNHTDVIGICSKDIRIANLLELVLIFGTEYEHVRSNGLRSLIKLRIKSL